MKKILLILSVLLVVFSACGTSLNKVVKDTESFLEDVSKDKDDFESFIIDGRSKESIKDQNRIYELKDMDFEIKKTKGILAAAEDDTYDFVFIELDGDAEEYTEHIGYSNSYCVVDNIVVLDYSDTSVLKKLCKSLDGEYEE